MVGVGSGPSGVALRHDGNAAYVYNSFDHTLSTLAVAGWSSVRLVASSVVVNDSEQPTNWTWQPSNPIAIGRTLFYSAVDPNITSTGIACASCHLDGREDGHVWHFDEGPRRTPSLAGRQITSTAPFHWSGQFATMSDFLDETIIARMGGSGGLGTSVVSVSIATAISAFIDSLEAPDNPHQLATPTASQIRGASLFQAAGCATCHGGTATINGTTVQLFTNNGFANVGTFDVGDDIASLPKGFNVPSLLGLARTAPYLHDGSAPTFLDRLRRNQMLDLHGNTSTLTSQDLSDLSDYLKSL